MVVISRLGCWRVGVREGERVQSLWWWTNESKSRPRAYLTRRRVWKMADWRVWEFFPFFLSPLPTRTKLTSKKKELMKRNFLGFWDAAAGSSNISQQGIEEIDTSIHASRRHPFLLLPLFREQESMKHTTSSLLHFFYILSISERVCVFDGAPSHTSPWQPRPPQDLTLLDTLESERERDSSLTS